MLIKKIQDIDLQRIASIHKLSFDDSHFSNVFSDSMLIQYLKLLIELNPYSYAVYSEDGSEVIGFIIAGENTQKALNIFAKQHFKELAIVLVLNPRFIFAKIYEIFCKLTKQRQNKTRLRVHKISIANEYKGQGLGGKLLDFLETNLKNDGILEYGLSVHKENKSAVNFYFQKKFILDYEDRKSLFFVKSIKK